MWGSEEMAWGVEPGEKGEGELACVDMLHG